MKKTIFSVMLVVFLMVGSASANVNPFMDVPLGNWAYDAVAQLSARGVVSGYPDGTYKGNQPMTRYEFASSVARALANVDMTKASKTDVELLKKLVVEFKNELVNLGVKVSELDSRVAVLENDIGGWSISGRFNFRADTVGEDNSSYAVDGKTDFYFKDAELSLNKRIDDRITFYSTLAVDKSSSVNEDIWFKNFFVRVNMPFDVTMDVGRFTHDWSYYKDESPWFGDVQKNGFRFVKSFSKGTVVAYVNHEEANTYDHFKDSLFVDSDVLSYGMKADFQFNEKIAVGAEFNKWQFDSVGVNGTDDAITAYNVNGAFMPWSGVKLYGEYWWQKADMLVTDNTSNAYRAVIDVNQDVLKYTSVWVEYSHFERNFMLQNDPYKAYGADILSAMELNSFNGFAFDTNVWFVRLDQRLTDKWGTFQRYVKANNDSPFDSAVTNYTFGVKYHYTPALTFSLAYDKVDYEGLNNRTDDHLVRFQTQINF